MSTPHWIKKLGGHAGELYDEDNFARMNHEENQHWLSRLRKPEPQHFRCETYQGLVCELLFAEGEGTWCWSGCGTDCK